MGPGAKVTAFLGNLLGEDDEEDADFTAQLRKELDATEGQSAPTGALAEKMQQ